MRKLRSQNPQSAIRNPQWKRISAAGSGATGGANARVRNASFWANIAMAPLRSACWRTGRRSSPLAGTNLFACGISNPAVKLACCRIWRKSSAPPLPPMAGGWPRLPRRRVRGNPFCFGTWPPKRSPPLFPPTSGYAPGASPFHRTSSGSLSGLCSAASVYGI